MIGRQVRRDDLNALIGLHVTVTVGDRTAEGVIASTGYGVFGGLFVEFADGDTSIGWSSEESATITISTGSVDQN